MSSSHVHETVQPLTAERIANHNREQFQAIDNAWRAVNALGGTYDHGNPYEAGYAQALEDALNAIEKLGGIGGVRHV
jgi:hypothetical protein